MFELVKRVIDLNRIILLGLVIARVKWIKGIEEYMRKKRFDDLHNYFLLMCKGFDLMV